MSKIIYFNQWFSSITNIIEDIKQKMGEEVYIIASSQIKDHVYSSVVDKFIYEDWVEDNLEESYLNFVLDICKENKVDIFFVRKHASLIAKNIEKFYALGIKVVAEDYKTILSVDNKCDNYEFCIEKGFNDIVPEFIDTRKISDETEAAKKVLEILTAPNEWCLKFAIDEGGASFRKIKSSRIIDENSLKYYSVNEITKTDLLKTVIEHGKSLTDKLIFMEMLDSPEISVDCYNSNQGFIALCREKEAGRKESIYYNEEIANICSKLGAAMGLKYPFNVQFRVKAGCDKSNIKNLRLLEINTRMAGGAYYGLLFGANICEVCLKDLMGRTDYNIEVFKPSKCIKATHVEKAILIGE